jgi:hypothetical protein
MSKDDLDNVRRGVLRRLLLHRGVSEIVVANMVEDIMDERPRWTAATFGQRLEVTFEEWKRVHLGNVIAPIDRTKDEMRAHFRKQKQLRDRIRMRKVRAQTPKTTTTISPRAEQLAAMLNADWLASTSIMEIMKAKWRLKREIALRVATLRASRELVDAGIAERKTEPGPSGGYVTFVRRSPTNIGVSAKARARSADKIRAARRSDSNLFAVQRTPYKNESLPRRSAAKPGTTGNDTLH